MISENTEASTEENLFEKLRKEGFVRIQIDGNIFTLDDEIKINKNKKHTIEIVVDRIIKNGNIKLIGVNLLYAVSLNVGM